MSDMMDQKDEENMGTLFTSGEFRRDEPPVHRFSNPMTNCSHISLWDGGKWKRACGLKATDLSKSRARSISEVVDISRFQR